MHSEFQPPIDDNMSSGSGFNAEMLEHLRTAGKWGRFLSILGMAFLALFILLFFFVGSTGLAGLLMGGAGTPDGFGAAAGVGTFVFIIYGLFFAFSFYLYYLLYRFSVEAIKTADDHDQLAATRSFKALATLFKIVGILTAIYLGVTLLFTGAMVFGGIAGSLGT